MSLKGNYVQNKENTACFLWYPDKIQLFHNKNSTKYITKIHTKQNTNKYNLDKIQIQIRQHTNETKYKKITMYKRDKLCLFVFATFVFWSFRILLLFSSFYLTDYSYM